MTTDKKELNNIEKNRELISLLLEDIFHLTKSNEELRKRIRKLEKNQNNER